MTASPERRDPAGRRPPEPRAVGPERRAASEGGIPLVAVAAGLGTGFGVVRMLIAVISGTPEAYSAAAGYWALAGLLMPLVVALVAERQRRDLGLWAGGALLVGGAMIASAPLIVLAAHGTWDAAVHYPGRVSGSEMPLAVFAWLAGIVAAVLLVSGAYVLGRRGRGAEGPTP